MRSFPTHDDLAAQLRGLIHNSLFEGPDPLRDVRKVRVSESLRGRLAELIFAHRRSNFKAASRPVYLQRADPRLCLSLSAGQVVILGLSWMPAVWPSLPALLPVIYGQDGVGAYGAFLVSRQVAVEKGVVSYSNSVIPAALFQPGGK